MGCKYGGIGAFLIKEELMRAKLKFIYIAASLIIIGSLSAGCQTLPFFPATDMQTGDAIRTAAAATVIAEVTQTAQALPTVETPHPTPTEPVTLPPSPTPLPDLTPTPQEETPLPTPTPVAETPEPTPTLTPVQPYTEVIFRDDFSTLVGWFVDETDEFRFRYQDGGYRILNGFQASYVNSIRSFDLPNVYVETEARQVAGPQDGYFGVVCRWQDVHNFYGLAMGQDGFLTIVRVQDRRVSFLATGVAESGLLNPAGQNNRIGGSCVGSNLTLYVNGEQVLQAQDTSFGDGFIGLMVGTRSAAGVEAHFDNFLAARP
jgi:hypothetical protein